MRLRQFGQLPRAFDLAQLPKDNSQVDRRSGLCICALAKRELNIERGVIARERRLEMRAGIGEGSLIRPSCPTRRLASATSCKAPTFLASPR